MSTQIITKTINEGPTQRCSSIDYLYSWNSIVIPQTPKNGTLINVEIHGFIYGNSSQGGLISYREIDSSLVMDAQLKAYLIKSTGTGSLGQPTFPANTIGIDSKNFKVVQTKEGEARHLQFDISDWRKYLTGEFGEEVDSIWLQENGYAEEITIDFIYEISELPPVTKNAYIGRTQIQNAKIGNLQVDKIYLGNNLIWKK